MTSLEVISVMSPEELHDFKEVNNSNSPRDFEEINPILFNIILSFIPDIALVIKSASC